LITSGTSQNPATVYAANKPAAPATHRFHLTFIELQPLSPLCYLWMASCL
jgi:hypothetical protein